MKIIVEHYWRDDSETNALLRQVLKNTEKLLVANAETKAILQKIDDETTAVGVKVTDLLAQVKTGMTSAEVAEVNAAGEAIAARLTAIAADENNPIPVEPPIA